MSAPTQTADRLGEFEVLAELSAGGMGNVLLARRQRAHGFEKLFAIKTIRADLLELDRVRAMFLDEARLVSRLNHPSIAQVYDFGEDSGTLYMVMELVAGVSLSAVLKRRGGGLPAAVACRVAAEVCRGLHAAHEARDQAGQSMEVVHRDVSPQNVMMTFAGGIKVIDFGIALVRHRISPETQTGQLKGKPAYMAPEQLHHGAVDRRTDLFAVGAVLFEMLTGEPLFSRPTLGATVTAVLHDDVPPPSQVNPEVTPELDQLVKRALQRELIARFQTGKEMASALETAATAIGSGSVEGFAEQELVQQKTEYETRVTDLLSQPAGIPGGRDPEIVTMTAGPGLDAVSPDSKTVELSGGSATKTAAQRNRPRWAFVGAFALAVVSATLVWQLPGSHEESSSSDDDDTMAAERVEPFAIKPQVEEAQSAETAVRPAVDAEESSRLTGSRKAKENRRGTRRKKKKLRRHPQEAAKELMTEAVPPPANGYLRIAASPFAHVRVDGRQVGITPLKKYAIPSGAHTIELIDPENGRVRLRREVTITAGNVEQITLP